MPKEFRFFFVWLDQARTITKRHCATRLQLARFAGACPLWDVHQAFETPTRFLRQLAETPDGMYNLCIANDVLTQDACSHANLVIYADGMAISAFGPLCDNRHALPHLRT